MKKPSPSSDTLAEIVGAPSTKQLVTERHAAGNWWPATFQYSRHSIGWICHSSSNMDTHLLHASSFSTAFSRLLMSSSSSFSIWILTSYLYLRFFFLVFFCSLCIYVSLFSSFSFSFIDVIIARISKSSGLSELARIGHHSEVVSGQCLCSASTCYSSWTNVSPSHSCVIGTSSSV